MNFVKMIPSLNKNDLIYITSPAKAIEKEFVDFAISFLKENGYQVKIGQHSLGQHHYFSGTIEERSHDFNQAIQDPEVKAIICARGGYGCIQLDDLILWDNFKNSPKWIVGFSDVTVFHQKIQSFNLPSIHATMPLNFRETKPESLSSLFSLLAGEKTKYIVEKSSFNITGSCEGQLVGGNLSILYCLIGTSLQPDYTGKILFIEDLAEQLYHIDRMFWALEKAQILSQISGLVVGGMTDLKDTEQGFGMTYQEIIITHLKKHNIPVLFNFPAGHIEDNRALLFGVKHKLQVTENEGVLTLI
jgi:muramoyltetrapeptide carboxypeptidase